jgi:hypothetical protein
MLKWLKRDKGPGGPDFSSVYSQEKAEELHRQGVLHKLLLMPAEFGGAEIPQNVVFVPEWVVAEKAHIDLDIIRPLIEEGTVSRYFAAPEYERNSFIPCSIRIVASDPGQFEASVAIWGKALQQK